MKHGYALAGLLWWFSLSSGLGQNRLFKGHWYVGTDVGIFSSQTRMVAGELTKYSSGSSGIMPLYGVKAGRIINPYFSVETGVYSLPLNLVYLYQTDRIIGANSLRFLSVPVRANWRVRVFHNRLEAHVGAGVQYVRSKTPYDFTTFSGLVTSRGHTWTDSLAYSGSVGVVRQHSLNAELTLSINWALSRRWTMSMYGRQVVGMMNIAQMDVAIKNNQEPIDKARFVTKGAGFITGVGIRYNLAPKRRFN